jgi:hypothetical protein
MSCSFGICSSVSCYSVILLGNFVTSRKNRFHMRNGLLNLYDANNVRMKDKFWFKFERTGEMDGFIIPVGR